MKIKDTWEIEDQQTTLFEKNLPTIALVGAPDDRGVMNVGGRLGAGHGPALARKLLSSMTLGMKGELKKVKIRQGCDITTGASIEEAHSNLVRQMLTEFESGNFPLIVGGGHDFGFPHFLAAADFYSEPVAVINIDAHLDVRPVIDGQITSGAPFFMALESGRLKSQDFVEFGIQSHCNDEDHYRYLEKKSVRIVMLNECRRKPGVVANFEAILKGFSKRGCKIVVSLDVDAVSMAFAPGVSAPQIEGFSPEELFGILEASAVNKSVVSVGFFEFAPPLDENQKTARLLATAIHRFCSAFSRRGQSVLSQRLRVPKLLKLKS